MSRLRAAVAGLFRTARRALELAWKALRYLWKYGPTAFVARVRDRLHSISARMIPRNPRGLTEAYSSLLRASRSKAKSADYVPLLERGTSPRDLPVKLIAFYLPQFHPIPENDRWWGRGFTEWTNTSKAIPQFVGHYQPHLPGELGFYDLRVPEVQERQIELARTYGLHGFAFYYYWFNGKRLLERPIDQFYSRRETNFPYCIFWANENWTRRWDGKEEDVLIRQEHSAATDISFIQDIEHFLRDERYLRIERKPVLMLYRVELLPDPKATVEIWRQYCQKVGIGEIYLIAGQVYGFEDPRPAGFDAAVEFPPHNARLRSINRTMKILNPSYDGTIFDYRDLAAQFVQHPQQAPYQVFKTVAPAWDNEPRKPGRGTTFAFSSPSEYQKWLARACEYAVTQDEDKRIVFINAWNEWAEGAHLEPDRRYGYAYLQATRDALQALRPPTEQGRP